VHLQAGQRAARRQQGDLTYIYTTTVTLTPLIYLTAQTTTASNIYMTPRIYIYIIVHSYIYNKVTAGERYILGGFLLISNRVEHVRRLNNQGREARNQGDLTQARRCSLHCHAVAASTAARFQALVHAVAGAAPLYVGRAPRVAASPACCWLQARRLFKWALKLNPKCATCLKNWAESIYGGAMGDSDGSVPPKLAEVPTY